jgi:Domain of unknown function (DUF4296)
MRILSIFLVFILMAGCVNNDRIPSGILPKDKMGPVMWDMIQADQFAKLYLAKDSLKLNLKIERMKLYEEIFALHHTTKAEFEKSYQFYMGRPDLSKVMFDSLSAYTTRQRQEIYKSPAVVHPKPATPVKTVPPIKVKTK